MQGRDAAGELPASRSRRRRWNRARRREAEVPQPIAPRWGGPSGPPARTRRSAPLLPREDPLGQRSGGAGEDHRRPLEKTGGPRSSQQLKLRLAERFGAVLAAGEPLVEAVHEDLLRLVGNGPQRP